MFMIYEFDTNEATAPEVLAFMKCLYKTQISGAPFTIYNLNNWIRIGKLPDTYGGNRIKDVQRYKELCNLLVLTIEGWDRVEVEEVLSSRSHGDSTKNYLLRQKAPANPIKPHKQRTILYYQTIEKSG